MSRVTPPQMIGVHDVADLFGVTPDRIRRRLRAKHQPTLIGYFGKVGGRHIWNAHELFSQVFSTDVALDDAIAALTNPNARPVEHRVACGAAGCGHPVVFASLCRRHLRHFMHAWYRAADSTLVLQQFVGMCRWVVERNIHVVLPADFDPFAQVCMTPGCGGSTNRRGDQGWHGPLCVDCSNRFWNHMADPGWRRPTRKAS